MLEKPDIKDEEITDCLHAAYGLSVKNLGFLPLGADLNTAVYRVVTTDETAYFLKLRRGEFNEAAVTVPNYLSGLGVNQIIRSLTTQSGQPWTRLKPYTVILYPYVEGQNGFERAMSDQQWVEFGVALKKFHTADIPSGITDSIAQDKFSPRWRETARLFLTRMEEQTFVEPVAVQMAAFLRVKRDETLALIQRAERFAQMLMQQPPAFILCHADIHAWNLLLDDKGAFYIVDWDTLIFAPKERDLMFVGGGLGGYGHSPQQEEALFYAGYGQTQIDPVAMAYYRYERIVEDIAVCCEQVFLSDDGGEDRRQALKYLKSNYAPNGTIAMASQSDKTHL